MILVQAAGFEPAKRYAEDLEPSPFDHSGTPAEIASVITLLILAPPHIRTRSRRNCSRVSLHALAPGVRHGWR